MFRCLYVYTQHDPGKRAGVKIKCKAQHNNKGGQLKRTMKTRHLIMLSLGGVISTGLFFNTGYIISTTGAAGTLPAYLIAPGGLAGDAVPWRTVGGDARDRRLPRLRPCSWPATNTVAWLYWLTWTVARGLKLHAAGFCMRARFPAGAGLDLVRGVLRSDRRP